MNINLNVQEMQFEQQNPDLPILIAKAMAEGKSQDETVAYFQKEGITPNSKSIIEKTIKRMKQDHKANNLFHLACILKDKGVI